MLRAVAPVAAVLLPEVIPHVPGLEFQTKAVVLYRFEVVSCPVSSKDTDLWLSTLFFEFLVNTKDLKLFFFRFSLNYFFLISGDLLLEATTSIPDQVILIPPVKVIKGMVENCLSSLLLYSRLVSLSLRSSKIKKYFTLNLIKEASHCSSSYISHFRLNCLHLQIQSLIFKLYNLSISL